MEPAQPLIVLRSIIKPYPSERIISHGANRNLYSGLRVNRSLLCGPHLTRRSHCARQNIALGSSVQIFLVSFSASRKRTYCWPEAAGLNLHQAAALQPHAILIRLLSRRFVRLNPVLQNTSAENTNFQLIRKVKARGTA